MVSHFVVVFVGLFCDDIEHVVDAFGELIVGVSIVFLFVGVVLVGDAEETGDDEGEVLFCWVLDVRRCCIRSERCCLRSCIEYED